MTVLLWGIKSSLLSYVSGMADGEIAVEAPAERRDSAFAFPGEDVRFRGGVAVTGHSGLMRVRIGDPSLRSGPGGRWILEIADPDEPAVRLPFAEVGSFDGEHGRGLRMTEHGADLFFGPYGPGTPVDDFQILGGAARGAD